MADTAEKSFADQVTEVVDKLVQKGDVWELPEDLAAELPEAVVYAAKQEKRIRDNSAAFHRANKRAKELETINSRLTEHVIENSTLHLSTEQRTELDELKLTDPETWRAKLTSYENEAKTILRTKIGEITSEGQKLSELDERTAKVAAFKETTGIELTDNIIENQLPASYSKQLEKGEITFDQFLTKAQTFLSKEKTILGAGDTPPETVDLGKLPGGQEPSEPAQEGDLTKKYIKETIF